jgi:hypothetical protein
MKSYRMEVNTNIFFRGGFMKLFKFPRIILSLICLQSALAEEKDTVWICREDTAEQDYAHIFLSDTFPDNRGQFNMVDTEDTLQGKYIDFNYQFGNPNPGYAGFKIYWDNGVVQFWVEEYDSMVLWHKGPLPGHKVRMIWACGRTGTQVIYEYFGEFKASSVWKRESFPFPKKRNYGAAPDSQFDKKGLFELRMQIFNDSTVGTSPTSPPGNLKIDNMFFFKATAHLPEIWEQPGSQTVAVGKWVNLRVIALGGRGGEGALTYQWIKNGSPISETTSKYDIYPVQPSDAGSYTVSVTNSLGSVTSDPAILTVEDDGERKGCGCGSGTGLALIPLLFYKAMAHRKRKKKNPAS